MDVSGSGSLLKSVLAQVCSEDLQVTTTSRVVLVGSVLPGAGERVGGFVDAWVAGERARESNPTGLVLVQPRCALLVVESQPETIVALVRALCDATERGGGEGKEKEGVEGESGASVLFGEVRVLAATEDCPAPLFGRLYMAFPSASATIGGSGYGSVDLGAEDVAPACWHVYSKLLHLASLLPAPHSIGGMGDTDAVDDEIEAAMAATAAAQETLVKDHGTLLPPDAILTEFAKSPKIPSVQEYAEIFAAPTRVVPVAEQVWPPPEDL